MCCVQVLRPIRLVVASRILIRFKLADDRPGVHWPRPGPSRCVDLPNVDICDRNDKRNFAGHGECCLDSMSTVGRMGGFRRQNSGSSIRIRVFLRDSKARRDAALAARRSYLWHGNNEAAWRQIVLRSSECDALGGVSKKSQAVHQNAKPVAVKPYAYP
jgi:hypothetical protein